MRIPFDVISLCISSSYSLALYKLNVNELDSFPVGTPFLGRLMCFCYTLLAAVG